MDPARVQQTIDRLEKPFGKHDMLQHEGMEDQLVASTRRISGDVVDRADEHTIGAGFEIRTIGRGDVLGMILDLGATLPESLGETTAAGPDFQHADRSRVESLEQRHDQPVPPGAFVLGTGLKR